MRPYSPQDWFWRIGDDESRFWSSAAGTFVQALPEGAEFTRIASEQELSDVLRAYGLPGPVANSEDINAERERRIALPLMVTVAGLGSFPIDMGVTSQRNLNGLASAAILRTMQGDTTLVTFRDADNVDQDLTPQQVLQMAMQAAARIDAVYKRSWEIKAMQPIPADFRDDAYWAIG